MHLSSRCLSSSLSTSTHLLFTLHSSRAGGYLNIRINMHEDLTDILCFNLYYRFVGYPGNYSMLLGIRNEDVSVYTVGSTSSSSSALLCPLFYSNNLRLHCSTHRPYTLSLPFRVLCMYCMVLSLFCVVWILWVSHWISSRAVSHHGRKTAHQQCPGIYHAVRLYVYCI